MGIWLLWQIGLVGSPAQSLTHLARAHPQLPNPEEAICRASALGGSPLVRFIDFHQSIISPADGPRSHFVPVSSTYARGALRAFGLPGLTLIFDRLLRENQQAWVYQVKRLPEGVFAKLDPVPLVAFR